MNNDIAEKVKKLLALAGNGSDHEAQAALLKARALIARYKLDEKAVRRTGPAKLTEVELKEQVFSGLRNTWKAPLSRVIAEHHCCASVTRQYKGAKTGWIVFVGLDDDPRIAAEVFQYAVRHIRAQKEEYREFVNRLILSQTVRNDKIRVWEANYTEGFTRGLQAQYEEQFAQAADGENMTLALTQPAEVEAFERSLKPSKMHARSVKKSDLYREQGFRDGKKFQPVKSITPPQHRT